MPSFFTLVQFPGTTTTTELTVLQVKSDGISKSGKKYNNEYMLTFHFAGEKIVSMKEFTDSKYSDSYFAEPNAS